MAGTKDASYRCLLGKPVEPSDFAVQHRCPHGSFRLLEFTLILLLPFSLGMPCAQPALWWAVLSH